MLAIHDHPQLLRCSAAYRIHMYIVDRLFGDTCSRMVVGGQLCAEVMLCILLIYPLQPGRARIICKHRKEVYNKDVSVTISKGMVINKHV